MKVVYKYSLPWDDYCELDLPKDVKILHFDVQHDVPRIWALVDPSQPVETRRFRLAGTGHSIIEEDLTYIGSTLHLNGKFVWHLFEIGR